VGHVVMNRVLKQGRRKNGSCPQIK